MKPLIITLCCAVLATAYSCKKNESCFKVADGDNTIEITCISDNIIKVSKYHSEEKSGRYSPSVVMTPQKVTASVITGERGTSLTTANVRVYYDNDARQITFSDNAGNVLLKEKPGIYSLASQTFLLDKDEPVYGLGQHQQGIMNYRGNEVQLSQSNMEIAIPVVHSQKGYAVFWDNCSTTLFNDNESGMSFSSETGTSCDYYFIYGGDAEGVIRGIRELTGDVPMSPLWLFGFLQSKERYASQDELLSVVRKYRELGVPLDGIIQDWQYWGEDNTYWNAVQFRNPGFPDPDDMIKQVKALNANALISIWPSFGKNTDIFKELDAKNLLLANDTYPNDCGTRVYDTWDDEAKDIYWKYIKENIYDKGFAGYWLDATEPEKVNITVEDFDYQTPAGTFREVHNSFPIVSVGGVYDRQRAFTDEKRVVILTRSAYFGQQRYGTHVWSGDVFADWQVLHDQIPAALNFTLCGMPYWNSDIGGFWTWREFPEGVEDPEYQKLFIRWAQFGVFTGMMRAHGTNTPREIFRFGKKGDRMYDVYEKFINLRYRLLPYIYSTAWQVTSSAGSLMRPLVMDWKEDRNVWDIKDEYMFGKSFLVAPVVAPEDSRNVYLPEGKWFDFWNGKVMDGPATIERETPVEEIPVYVKAGTVLPVGPSVQYASEKPWSDLQIRIYPGADGEFSLYEDGGDGYGYEEGKRSVIRMSWNDENGVLTIHKREGDFPGMLKDRCFRVCLVGDKAGSGMDNEKYSTKVVYNGSKMEINLK